MRMKSTNEQIAYSIDIDGQKCNLRFSAAHYIHGHPTCGRLHGHDFTVHISVDGALDSSGIVLDFLDIESSVRNLISVLDHKILLAKRLTTIDGQYVRFDTSDGETVVPVGSVSIIDVSDITSELLARSLLSGILDSKCLVTSSISRISVGISESNGRIAWATLRMT